MEYSQTPQILRALCCRKYVPLAVHLHDLCLFTLFTDRAEEGMMRYHIRSK